jgi:cell wall-associated NlpC family hydrolase
MWSKSGWRVLVAVLGIGLIGMATPTPGLATTVQVPPAAAAALPTTPATVAVRTALSELGKPYRYGAAGPRAFDCSGLTLFAYRAAGINLPHYAAAQYRSGRRVARSDLQPGDLIFWAGLGHVGIYLGGGQMIHAPRPGHVVSITSIDEGRFVGAVRPG